MNISTGLKGLDEIVHYAAWLEVQSKEPDFGVHFPHAGGKRYWNDLIRELQEILYGEVT